MALSTAAGAPLGSAVSDNANSNNKRSQNDSKQPAAAAAAETTMLSPYAQRMKELQEARRGNNKIFVYLNEDILECIPGKLWKNSRWRMWTIWIMTQHGPRTAIHSHTATILAIIMKKMEWSCSTRTRSGV
jgi:hypothetical protein